MAEEYQRLGIDLLTAIERLGDFRMSNKSDSKRQEESVEAPTMPDERNTVAQNQAAMQQLEQMMMGVR